MKTVIGIAASLALGIGTAWSGSATAQTDSPPIFQTRQGRVEGTRRGDLSVYQSIPYALAPIGDLRWRAPQPPKTWRGTRPATAFARPCPQRANPILNPSPVPTSEDCLFLNIWSPAKPGGKRLPILVWIHGGGFSWGATTGEVYDGASLARKGVIVVSIAYRLGPLGFLALPELSAESPHRVSGNYGLLDQIAALRWIRDNAAAFGGNPRQVTLMGESAGGESIRLLIQSPLARGLFHRAIAESSADFGTVGRFPNSLRAAERSGTGLLAAAGARSVRDLRALSADEVLRLTPPGPQVYSLDYGWPVRDGYVLPLDVAKAYRTRRVADTPILIGNNSREWDIFPAATSVAELREQALVRFGASADRVLALYPANDAAEAKQASNDLLGDMTFGLNNYHWAALQLRYSSGPTFYYHFDQSPPARKDRPAGATHGAELPYVFDNLDARPLAWTADDRAVADMLSTYWTNFAKSGNPNGEGPARWPSYSMQNPQVLYIRSGKAELGAVPSANRMRMLEEVVHGDAGSGDGGKRR